MNKMENVSPSLPLFKLLLSDMGLFVDAALYHYYRNERRD